MNDFEKIVSAARESVKVLISSHVNPDGDAIGSELAMYHLIRSMGKKAHIINQDAVPGNLLFLPGAAEILTPDQLALPYDCTFMLDCGQSDRAGDVFIEDKKGYGLVVNIDHHLTATPWADLNWVDQAAGSTSEMIYSLIRQLIGKPDLDMALCIYTGIVADTGSFRYSNTTAGVFSLASSLVSMGVDPAQVASHLYENTPYKRIKLLGIVLRSIGITDDGLVSWISMPASALEETDTRWEDTEEFINYPRSISTVRVALSFKQISSNTVKVSLRSQGRIDVARMALKYGGGGHKNAAGFSLNGDLDEIKDKVIREVHRELLK